MIIHVVENYHPLEYNEVPLSCSKSKEARFTIMHAHVKCTLINPSSNQADNCFVFSLFENTVLYSVFTGVCSEVQQISCLMFSIFIILSVKSKYLEINR